MVQNSYWVGWIDGYGLALFDPSIQTKDPKNVILYLISSNDVIVFDRETTRAITKTSKIENDIERVNKAYKQWKAKRTETFTAREQETPKIIELERSITVELEKPKHEEPEKLRNDFQVGYFNEGLIVIVQPLQLDEKYVHCFSVNDRCTRRYFMSGFMDNFVEETDLHKIHSAITTYENWRTGTAYPKKEASYYADVPWSNYTMGLTSFDFDNMPD